MPKKGANISLSSYDDIFETDESRADSQLEKVQKIPINELVPFKNHPFKVVDDEAMLRTTESIAQFGVLTPLIARPLEDGGYEIISGHRRAHAAEAAGLTEVPVIVRDMDDDAATVLMVDSNLQRESILPSERAFAYKMKLEAMKRMPGRPGKGAPVEHNLKGIKSRDALAEQVGESKDQVRRYIRLTELLPELLEMVDDKKIGMRPAVELSYIPKLVQCDIWEALEQEQCTPTHEQARRMRRMSEEGKLTKEAIEAIMSEKKPNQKEKIVLRGDRFKDLFPKNLPLTKREDYVAAAMEYYGKYLERMRNVPER